MELDIKKGLGFWPAAARKGCAHEDVVMHSMSRFGLQQLYDINVERLKSGEASRILDTPATIREQISRMAARLEIAVEQATDYVTQLTRRVEALEKSVQVAVESEDKRLQLREKLLKQTSMATVKEGDPFESTKDTWGVSFAELKKLLGES